MRRSKFKTEEFEQKPVVSCAHDGCPNPGIIAKRLPTGWANLCKKHDLFHAQQEANGFCRSLGLETYEQKRDWILAKLKSLRPTPAEHWKTVAQTPGLLPIAYEMANRYLERHAMREPGEEG